MDEYSVNSMWWSADQPSLPIAHRWYLGRPARMLLQQSTREMTNELINYIAINVDREHRMNFN